MQSSSRRTQLLVLAAFAATAVVALVLVSALGGDDSSEPGGSGPSLEGIPQQGTVLGEPGAPATLTEFADLQCPFCAEFATGAVPSLIDDYVRPGKLKLDFAVLAFLGPDSEEAARMAAAASLQDRLWNFVEAFYRNQGTENSGYVDEAFLSDIAEQAGVDVEQALAELDSPEVQRVLDLSAAAAERLGVNSTPSFALGGAGSPPRLVQVQALEAGSLDADIDEFLDQAR
ncbi:MAG: DsbA family protein [bacterium]